MKYKKNRDIILAKIPVLQYIDGAIHYKEISSTIRYYSNYKVDDDGKRIVPLADLKRIRGTIIKFLYKEPHNREVVNEFLNAKIEIIQERYKFQSVKKNHVIMVCLVKNDYERINQALEYYRGIGIKYFAFIDNDSTDGTFEYLRKQSDVNLYQVKQEYSTTRREGWLNRLYTYIGYDKWILCVDSDELFTYIGCEEHSIEEYISMLPEKVKRVHSLMLDMYSDSNVFRNIDECDSFEQYPYFDADTYHFVSTYRCSLIHGGPRKRLFSEAGSPFNCTVSKYPLFYYEKGLFQGCSHWLCPYDSQKTLYGVLRHYKFMNGDMQKIQERVKKGNYASGSIEYKRYLEVITHQKEVTFMHENARKYNTSQNLSEICVDSEVIQDVFRNDNQERERRYN